MQRFRPVAQLRQDALPSSCHGVTHMCLWVTQCPFAPPLSCLIIMARHGTGAQGERMGLPSFTPAFSEAGDSIAPPGKGVIYSPHFGEKALGDGYRQHCLLGLSPCRAPCPLLMARSPPSPSPARPSHHLQPSTSAHVYLRLICAVAEKPLRRSC